MTTVGAVHESLNLRIGEILRELDNADDQRLNRPEHRQRRWRRISVIDPAAIGDADG